MHIAKKGKDLVMAYDYFNQPDELPRSEWHRLSRRPPNDPPQPSIDTLVHDFLELHGVLARKPRRRNMSETPMALGSIGDALNGAVLGGLGGPLAVGIGSHLRNQEKIARRQEELLVSIQENQLYQSEVQSWDHWKQWALAHPDWPTYKEECFIQWEELHDEARLKYREFLAWLSSGEGQEEQSLIMKRLRKEKQDARSLIKFQAISASVAVLLLAGFIIFLAYGFVAALQYAAILLLTCLVGLCYLLYKDSF